jgi:hypothetical protein
MLIIFFEINLIYLLLKFYFINQNINLNLNNDLDIFRRITSLNYHSCWIIIIIIIFLGYFMIIKDGYIVKEIIKNFQK